MLHVGDMWARAIVIGQAVAALGLNDDLLPYAQDVSRQMGGTLSEIWFAGDALDAGLQGGATWLLDSLGLTAAKLGRLYDNLSYRSPEFPIPVLPFGFSGPALSLVRSGAQWLDAKLMGNEPRADQAASRLLSMAGGAWLRIARRAGFSTPASDADWREVREMFSGRVTERVRGGTMLRILSDLLPGTPLDEQANWKEKIRARRAGERIRATGATTNAELRAMWREMQATKDPERQASVRARFNETVGRLAEERNMTMGDLKSLVSDLGRNFGYEEVPGRVRDIVTAVTQEEKVRLLSEALTDRWRPLLKDEAEYALARIVGKRKWRQFQAEVPPDQLVNLLSAWDQASLEWGASERPGAPAGSR
jgi:hypothetical protein